MCDGLNSARNCRLIISVFILLAMTACGGGGKGSGNGGDPNPSGNSNNNDNISATPNNYFPTDRSYEWVYGFNSASFDPVKPIDNREYANLAFDTGAREYYRSEAGLIAFHGFYSPSVDVQGDGTYKADFEFDSDMVLWTPTDSAGMRRNYAAQGTVFITPTYGARSFSVTGLSTFHGVEEITILANTYPALHISFEYTVSLTIDGFDLSLPLSSEFWLAENLGIIKRIDNGYELELTDFSGVDSDSDGVADPLDAYPNNSDFTERLSTTAGNFTFDTKIGTGEASEPQTISIVGSNLPWTLATEANWLVMDETSGTGDADVNLAIDLSQPAGEYTAELLLTNTFDNTEISIPITAIIRAPELTVSKPSLTLNGGLGWGRAMDSLVVSLDTGAIAHPLTVTASGIPDGVVSVSAPPAVSGEGAAITLTPADLSGLSAGTYNGTLTVSVNIGEQQFSTTADFTMLAPDHLILIPDNGVALSSFPTVGKTSHSVVVQDSYGLSNTSWTATTTADWIQVTKKGTTADELMISADATGLSTNTLYRATITVRSDNTAIENSDVIEVGFWVGSSDPQSTVTLEQGYTHLTTDPIRPFVYVNDSGTDVQVYNIYTQALITTIADVGENLSEMRVSENGSHLYVSSGEYNNTMVVVDLENNDTRTSWTGENFRYGFDLVRNQGELLLASYAKIYRASNGEIFESVGLANGFINSGGYLDFSLFGNRLCTLNSGISPFSLFCYAVHYNGITDEVYAEQLGGAIGPGSNGRDVALSPDGEFAHIASGSPYAFSVFRVESLERVSTLEADAYPNAIEVDPNGALHGGISSRYGPLDLWIYESSGELRKSGSASGYGNNIIDRALAISGDGQITVLLTDDPRLVFFSSY